MFYSFEFAKDEAGNLAPVLIERKKNKTTKKHTVECIYTEEWKNNDIDLNISITNFQNKLKSIITKYNKTELYDAIYNNEFDSIYNNILTLEKCKNNCLHDSGSNLDCIYDYLKYADSFVDEVSTINGTITVLNDTDYSINKIHITNREYDILDYIYDEHPDLFVESITEFISIVSKIFTDRVDKVNKAIIQKMNDGNDIYNRFVISVLLYQYLTTLNTTDTMLNTKHLHSFANQYIGYTDTIYKLIESIINYKNYNINDEKDKAFIDGCTDDPIWNCKSKDLFIIMNDID